MNKKSVDYFDMEMDKKELKFMNSRIRQFFQEHCEFKVFKEFLKKHNVDLTHKVILDAGCGSGYSTELILKEFHPEELVAFDIMPEQVALAKKRGLPATLFIGDIKSTGLPSNKYDATFVFGMLHHVSGWKSALREMHRVLKPSGWLLIEEPDKRAIDDAERYLRIHHPKESRFGWSELTEELEEVGFSVLESRTIYLGHFQSLMCRKETA